VRVDPRHPAIAAAAAAAGDTFGRAPVFVRSGGTLPVAAVFSADLGLPVVLMGFALRDDGLHGPNEKMHLPNFHRGVETSIRMLDRFSRLPSTPTGAARRPRPA
jgi:acetylornithine deacetylase/succinyl-diaminopimelate desuccinylase-like protein